MSKWQKFKDLIWFIVNLPILLIMLMPPERRFKQIMYQCEECGSYYNKGFGEVCHHDDEFSYTREGFEKKT